MQITNDELKTRVSYLASGFVRIAGLRTKESNVLLLTDGLRELLIRGYFSVMINLSIRSFPSCGSRACISRNSFIHYFIAHSVVVRS